MTRPILFALFISVFASHANSHECVVQNSQEMSMHFKDLSLVRTLHIIAGFAEKNLLIKTKRDVTIPIHYSCENWKSIVRDLNNKYDFRIYISGNKIIMDDQS